MAVQKVNIGTPDAPIWADIVAGDAKSLGGVEASQYLRKNNPQAVLEAIKQVDGIGSGLDADLWRGQAISQFMRSPDLIVQIPIAIDTSSNLSISYGGNKVYVSEGKQGGQYAVIDTVTKQVVFSGALPPSSVNGIPSEVVYLDGYIYCVIPQTVQTFRIYRAEAEGGAWTSVYTSPTITNTSSGAERLNISACTDGASLYVATFHSPNASNNGINLHRWSASGTVTANMYNRTGSNVVGRPRDGIRYDSELGLLLYINLSDLSSTTKEACFTYNLADSAATHYTLPNIPENIKKRYPYNGGNSCNSGVSVSHMEPRIATSPGYLPVVGGNELHIQKDGITTVTLAPRRVFATGYGNNHIFYLTKDAVGIAGGGANYATFLYGMSI